MGDRPITVRPFLIVPMIDQSSKLMNSSRSTSRLFTSFRGLELAANNQLTALGVQPSSISFQNLTLQSDKFICM